LHASPKLEEDLFVENQFSAQKEYDVVLDIKLEMCGSPFSPPPRLTLSFSATPRRLSLSHLRRLIRSEMEERGSVPSSYMYFAF
jgi:hypothetical protein